jgi:hypothetical protein
MSNSDEITPWEANASACGRVGIYSDDPEHDAILWVYGDFADDKQRLAYAQNIAQRLNGVAQQPVAAQKGEK